MTENIALHLFRKPESDYEEYQEINQAPNVLLMESPIKEINKFDFFARCNTKKIKPKKKVKTKTITVIDIINSELASTPILQENVTGLSNDNKRRPSHLITRYNRIVKPADSGLEEAERGYVNMLLSLTFIVKVCLS